MAKGRKTGGRPKGTPKTGGRKKGTPNRLTVLKRRLAPVIARHARMTELIAASETSRFEQLLKELLEQEQRPELEWWPDE
jgi:hypothetical protein